MQIRPDQLHRHLEAGELKDVYLVSGDEPLLVEESCDEIVAAGGRPNGTPLQFLHSDRRANG